MQILLIDDDPDDRALFCEAVKVISPATVCDVASNGEEGLLRLNSCRTLPAMVFLDINMPVMDGRETLIAIRSTPKLKSLPVTIYSTSTNIEEVRRFMSLGADYVTKPNSFNELVELLTKHMLALLRNEQQPTLIHL